MKWCLTIVTALIAIGFAAWWLELRSRSKDIGRDADTKDRLRTLAHEIDRAAMHDGIKFSRIIGTGIVADVTSLQEEIWAHPREEATNYIALDAWGNHLHCKLNQTGTNALYGINNYDLIVWSNGRNGIDELGNGDDIRMPVREIVGFPP